MSSNFNNAKVINVYYNKGDRKPYDVNGKPIAYIGEEFVGANEATEIRFHFGEELDSASAIIVAKRANGDTRLDPLTLVGTGVNSYFKISLNAWYAEYKGKMTIIFKAYNGTVTYDNAENPTQIVSTTGQIIVSDIFNLEVAYAPNASSLVPPFSTEDYEDWFFTLSTKLDKAQSITVVGALPTLTGDVYDDRYFYVEDEDEGTGRLYYINGSTAIEVVWQVGTLKLTATGNGELTADTGKISWNQPNGTASLGLYNNVNVGVGEDVFYYVKASGAITKGDVIQYAGYQGDHALAKRAVQSEINFNPQLIMGIAKQDIANGDFGYIAHFGKIEGVDTKGVAVNSFVWFDSAGSTPGAWTITKPAQPNYAILMAVIIKAETSSPANNGVMLVRPSITNINIQDIRNIELTSEPNGAILRYNNSNGYWQDSEDLTIAETDIANIEDGTTVVGKALGDQNGNTINTTYLTIANGASTYVPLSSKGQANGVVPLNSDGKISSVYLSGEQDDYVEYANLAGFPAVGEADIIYCAIDTGLIYRWTGSTYSVISPSLALGTTSSTAFPGDRGLATETKTNNIVNGTQTLTDTRITNSAVGVVPLQVNGVASTSTSLQEWLVNNSRVAFINQTGRLLTPAVTNNTTANNSALFLNDTGTIISRNINDTNMALVVRKQQGTGNILELQTGTSDKKLEFDVNGWLYQNGTRLFTQTGGNTNTFFGTESGNASITGTLNSGYGRGSLQRLTSGVANDGFGRDTLSFLTTGTLNSAFGTNAGLSLTVGSNNTFIGVNSGNNASQLANASNSTALGQGSFTDKSNQMVFGNASVTEFKFDRNASAIALFPQGQFVSSTFPTLLTEITTTNTNSARSVNNILATTSGDMTDGFGSQFLFSIRDNANVSNVISAIGSSRSGADNSGRIFFSTNNAGSTTEKMTILPNGNVGIGTGSPATLLSVVTSSNTDGIQIRRNAGATGSTALLGFRMTETDSVTNNTEIRGIRTNRAVNFDSDLSFHTFSNNTLGERLRIRDDGLVGINETSPSAQLQVKSGATDRVGLSITTTATSGHTANLLSLNSNSAERFRVEVDGVVRTKTTYANYNVFNNSNLDLSNNGAVISRNVADTNPALIVSLANASATGNIQVWQYNTNAIGSFNRFGFLGGQGIINNAGGTNSTLNTATTGTTISRNVNDSNVVLKVQQINASASGRLQEWIQGSTTLAYVTNAGDFFNAGGTYGTISDLRVKENIVEARDYTDDIMKLRVVKYSLKKDKEAQATKLGFIAQEVEEVFPNMIETSETEEIKDLKSIKMSVLIPMLVKTIQEQEKRIKDLEAKL